MTKVLCNLRRRYALSLNDIYVSVILREFVICVRFLMFLSLFMMFLVFIYWWCERRRSLFIMFLAFFFIACIVVCACGTEMVKWCWAFRDWHIREIVSCRTRLSMKIFLLLENVLWCGNKLLLLFTPHSASIPVNHTVRWHMHSCDFRFKKLMLSFMTTFMVGFDGCVDLLTR